MIYIQPFSIPRNSRICRTGILKNISLSLVFLWIFSACSGPKAAFTYQKAYDSNPHHVRFFNQSKNSYQYHWDFGDGHFSNDIEPKHQYVSTGRHKVSLTATKNNQSATYSQELIIDPPGICVAVIRTSLGVITVQLFDHCPRHRDHFIQRSEQGAYDGTIFHRVIKGFMVQGGDISTKPHTKGNKSNTNAGNKTIPAEISDTVFHVKGVLAAARQSDEVNPQKASSDSQFYIVQGRTVTDEQLDALELQKGISYPKKVRETMKNIGGSPQLDKEYTIFGQVISGLEVIDQIAEAKTDETDKPLEDIRIISIKIIK